MIARGGLDARETGPGRLHLIGTAATPLGGDHLEILIEVRAGAQLQVRSVAATLALPGRSEVHSTSRWVFEVGEGGCLEFDPEPLIVAGGSEHSARTEVVLGDGSHLRLRERTQMGRDGETGGAFTGTLVADVAGRPLLRHAVELGAGSAIDDVLVAPRAMSSELAYPDARPACVDGLHSARLPLAGGGTLTTWLGARLLADPSESFGPNC